MYQLNISIVYGLYWGKSVIDFFVNNEDAIIVGVIAAVIAGIILSILPDKKVVINVVKKSWCAIKDFYKREIKHEYTTFDIIMFQQKPIEKLSKRKRNAIDAFDNLDELADEELEIQRKKELTALTENYAEKNGFKLYKDFAYFKPEEGVNILYCKPCLEDRKQERVLQKKSDAFYDCSSCGKRAIDTELQDSIINEANEENKILQNWIGYNGY